MDPKFKKQVVADSETIGQLAKQICGYGYYDAFPNRKGKIYSIPIEAVEEYLSIGVMFANKKRSPQKSVTEVDLRRIHDYGTYYLGAMLAARKMAEMLQDPSWRLNEKAYREATLRLVLRDKRSMQLWMDGCYYIRYRDHKKNTKGKVIWCEAYFSTSRGDDAPEIL